MKPQQGRMAVVFVLVAALVLLAVGGGGAFFYGRGQLEPVSATHGKPVPLTVTPGESLDSLSADLAAKGLIRSQFWFGLFARYKGLAEHLKPGMFNVDSGMGASAIITRLGDAPDVPPRRLVFAEGLTVMQMADKTGQAGVGITRDQYLAAAKETYKAPFLRSRPAGNTSLEGFLFPDSYDLPEGASAHDLIQMQLDDFAKRALPLLPQPGAYQSLIIASIVEREAKFPVDQPLVAAVINNRLANGMRLQIDAIVVYGLNKVGEAMSETDRGVDTPYNSYQHAGLPPTPIANPGLATISAAVQPGHSEDLFYLSDTCGHNHYAKTDAEFEKLKQQYLGTPCSP